MSHMGAISRRQGPLLGICQTLMAILRGITIIVVGSIVIGVGVAATGLIITGDLFGGADDQGMAAHLAEPLKEYRSVWNGNVREITSVEDWAHSGPIGIQLWSWPEVFRSWIVRLISVVFILSAGVWLWGRMDRRKTPHRPTTNSGVRGRQSSPPGPVRVRSPLHR